MQLHHGLLCMWLTNVVTGFGVFNTLVPFRGHETKQYSTANSESMAPMSASDPDSADSIQLARDEFTQYFDFPLDDWQLLAGGEILKGHNVVLCSPTGSGKTVVGEMALHSVYSRGLKGIYTTPLKALSNQKFAELRQTFGAQHVGLSTGDISINRKEARVTVMTTEVYRNIAWRASGKSDEDEEEQSLIEEKLIYPRDGLEENAIVVLDEFHYMGQPGRGGVWEECVITSPKHTQIVGLSATLPNAAQLASWIQGVTGRKTVLVEAPGARPVPLRYLYATREGLFPLFRNADAGPGSPLGLLGYRGDGIPQAPPRSRKRNNLFSEDDDFSEFDVDDRQEKVPRGLKVNPALVAAAQRRMQRVNRSLEQQRQRARKPWEDDAADEKLFKVDRRKRTMSPREERRERDRLLKREMRKAVPSMPILLTRLKQKNLLPAIVFIFSRAGCNQAAENIVRYYEGPQDVTRDIMSVDELDDLDVVTGREKKRKGRQRGRSNVMDNNGIFNDGNGRTFRPGSNQLSEDVIDSMIKSSAVDSDDDDDEDDDDDDDATDYNNVSPLAKQNWNFYASVGFLTYDEIEMVASKITQFNEENTEIPFDDATSKQYLFGVGSHHAGMLPAHKAFVETVYRAGLMKVVFATETLAAGINMPARSTVICALAKRGDSSAMNLLETSNLLQMSGRAGRRGMDTDGTCVIVATPFENHEDAAKILIDPVKPIVSQFRPSYALTVNLVGRGGGKLEVAKNLVQNSFAMWEKRQLELSLASAGENDSVRDVLESAAEEKFVKLLATAMDQKVKARDAKFDVARLQGLVAILEDKELLKSCSKQFLGKSRSLELEMTTLQYLQSELKNMDQNIKSNVQDVDDEELQAMVENDRMNLLGEIEKQEARISAASKEVRRHPYSRIAEIANGLMESDIQCGIPLSTALAKLKTGGPDAADILLTAEDLSKFAKSTIVVRRKLRKLATSNPDIDSETLLLQQDMVEEVTEDSWDDVLAITKVLSSYGCFTAETSTVADMQSQKFEESTFLVTPAGEDVGMLGFENSLWCYVALAGTYDVMGSSLEDSVTDDFFDPINLDDDWENDEFDFELPGMKNKPGPYQEAENHLNHLLKLEPAELAGFMSCLISEGSRGGGLSVLDSFQRMTPRQQRASQTSLAVMNRLIDVQRKFNVDEQTARCGFDITNCEVVTAWAGGCSWADAMEIAGTAPGDLARTLSRALDAVRQFGNLKYAPIRKGDFEAGSMVNPTARGLHPKIRALCREAAEAMNRYPVKDPMPFEGIEDEIFEDDGEEDEEDEISEDGTEDDINNDEGEDVDSSATATSVT